MPWNVVIMLALMVISAALTALTAKKPQTNNPTPATLKDFDIPNAEEGAPQAVVFGDVWLPGAQVLWYGGLRSTAIPAKAASGGKK